MPKMRPHYAHICQNLYIVLKRITLLPGSFTNIAVIFGRSVNVCA